ncbi:sulfite exporter TauE/SafE family protein [Methanoculleus sp. Wushi-C6]|uniref:Probable membrane transporter protein n=1 Tax=Methanoculleus caldifontis TaxID=2651577 RepID=A0ABU3WZW0_9EURY|nr:sulfite exporter TauE/SafE family protein [Methanoculleus sp. Wushi-C6]MDV2481100.1 sulfite exporter TauE/SafE family protein [Methanoculleus sp. Wushi-C6]
MTSGLFARGALLAAVVATMLGSALVVAPPATPGAVLLLLAVGVVAGVFGGLIGVGGSTIMLPVMYFYLGFPEPVAIGTGLFVVVFTSLSGAVGHLARGNLDGRVAARIATGGLLGVLIGSWLFSFIVDHTRVLDLILGLIFLAPSIGMIRDGLRSGTRPEPERVGGTAPGHALFGATVGVLTGITGLGGGYALVPGLLYLFGAPVSVTMGTSLASMIPMAVVGGGIKLAEGYVAVGAGLILAAGSIAGAQAGAASIGRFRPATLKLVFGLYFLYAAIRFIAGFLGIGVP